MPCGRSASGENLEMREAAVTAAKKIIVTSAIVIKSSQRKERKWIVQKLDT